MTFSPSWYVTSAPPEPSGAQLRAGRGGGRRDRVLGAHGAVRGDAQHEDRPRGPAGAVGDDEQSAVRLAGDIGDAAGGDRDRAPDHGPGRVEPAKLGGAGPVLLLYSTVISASATRKTHEVMYLLPSATVRTGPDGSPAASTVRT